MIRVGLISRWHVHANEYQAAAAALPEVSIAGVWDEEQERGDAWAKELGVPFHSSLSSLLESGMDAVIVAAPTSLHREIILAAAAKGKHIFTEKVLGIGIDQVDDILSAVDAARVHLVLSLPRLTEPAYLCAAQVVATGQLGTLTSVRCRVAHDGAVPTDQRPNGWLPKHFYDARLCGGGALIDLGAHPIYLCNRLLGQPTEVSAHFAHTFVESVEDAAHVVATYACGALATIETGFTAYGTPLTLELHGTHGALRIIGTSATLSVRGSETRQIELPERRRTPIQQWVDLIERGTAPDITREDMRLLTLVNEAATLSHAQGRRIAVEELSPRFRRRDGARWVDVGGPTAD
jgi:predicted dehydrogenase